VQAGVLALAVLAGTAVGFVALREAFGERGPDIGESPALAGNGEIVFSREGVDGRFHLYAVRPDGSAERQITDDATNDTDPAVSPGGETIAYVHELDRKIPEESETDPGAPRIRVIATVPIEGGVVTWHTPDDLFASDPSWSPDGSTIAVVGSIEGRRSLVLIDATSGGLTTVLSSSSEEFAGPSWSPDGRWLVFASRRTADPGSWSLETIAADGSQRKDLGVLSSVPTSQAWSPDGSRIAFLLTTQQGTEGGDEVWTIAPDPDSAGLVSSEPPIERIAIAVEASLEPELAWAPDGSALLVSDGEWIYRVDATPSGDPRGNFVQLVEGRSPAWQPLPAGSEPAPSPTSEPTVSPSPQPAGRDIGLGFRLCHVQRMGGIDWYGDGTSGAAWTGARLTDQGHCPSELDGEYVVAADLDGDGRAEPGGMGFLDHGLLCRPVAATDLSGDGVLELVVLEEASSTPSYSLYQVSVPTSERSPGIYALFVAPPGYPAGGFPGDEPIRFLAGGDEGYSAAIDCEGYPEAPVLVVAWSNYVVEVDDTEDVYVTRLRLGEDGVFHVIESEHFTQDVGDPLPIDPAGKACGVDFHPF
jgi:Tol biopolymer transport system component